MDRRNTEDTERRNTGGRLPLLAIICYSTAVYTETIAYHQVPLALHAFCDKQVGY